MAGGGINNPDKVESNMSIHLQNTERNPLLRLVNLPGVDLEGVDLPVGGLEGAGVVLDKVVARASLAGAGSAAPDRAGPGTAEGDVKDLF